MDIREQVGPLQRKLMAAVMEDEGGRGVAFAAMLSTLALMLANVDCKHCRKNIGEFIKAQVPIMLKMANNLAAENSTAKPCENTSCH
jgi:hypothetical protein